MEEPEERPRDHELTDDDGGTGDGDESPAADRPPHLPADDDSELGDTDQHSDA